VAVTGEISLLHVGDLENAFIPLPQNKLLFDLTDDRERIDILIEKLTVMWATPNPFNNPLK